jgi:cytochrome c-type biogenesis protein CcmH
VIFWAIAGILLLAAVLALLVPLVRRRVDQVQRQDHGLAVLRDQLAELDRDRQGGRIDEIQADAARIEIERRILTEAGARSASPDSDAAIEKSRRRRFVTSTIVIFLVPATTLGLYVTLGSPGLQDAPLADRAAERTLNDTADERRQGLEDMASQLAGRLEDDPTDLGGWMLLGRTYQMLDEPASAVDAFRKATHLPTADAAAWSSLGEAMVQANDGLVPPEAKAAFEQAVSLMSAEPRARFYLGLAERQAGNVEAALAWWIDLEADSPADAPWQQLLSRRIDEAAAEIGVDLEDRRSAAAARSAERTVEQEEQRGPSAADMEAASRMAPEARLEMIEGMVAGLAARLEENPNDVDGWRRLGRSYQVLDQPDKAIEAFGQAANQAPDNVEAQLDYAHALFPPGTSEREMPPEFLRVIEHIREIDPGNPEGLFFGGLIADRGGDADKARALWSELLDSLPADSPVRAAVERRIEALDG